MTRAPVAPGVGVRSDYGASTVGGAPRGTAIAASCEGQRGGGDGWAAGAGRHRSGVTSSDARDATVRTADVRRSNGRADVVRAIAGGALVRAGASGALAVRGADTRARRGEATSLGDAGLADGQSADDIATRSPDATGGATVGGATCVLSSCATGGGFSVVIRMAWSSGRAASTSADRRATARPTRGTHAGTRAAGRGKSACPCASARHRRAQAWHMPSENLTCAPRQELTP